MPAFDTHWSRTEQGDLADQTSERGPSSPGCRTAGWRRSPPSRAHLTTASLSPFPVLSLAVFSRFQRHEGNLGKPDQVQGCLLCRQDADLSPATPYNSTSAVVSCDMRSIFRGAKCGRHACLGRPAGHTLKRSVMRRRAEASSRWRRTRGNGHAPWSTPDGRLKARESPCPILVVAPACVQCPT